MGVHNPMTKPNGKVPRPQQVQNTLVLQTKDDTPTILDYAVPAMQKYKCQKMIYLRRSTRLVPRDPHRHYRGQVALFKGHSYRESPAVP